MPGFTSERNRLQQPLSSTLSRSMMTAFGLNRDRPSSLPSHRTSSERAAQPLLDRRHSDAVSQATEISPSSHDFSRITIHPRTEAKRIAAEQRASWTLRDKGVDAKSGTPVAQVDDKDPEQGKGPKDTGTPAPKPAPSPTPSAEKKKAGVESFEVNWEKGASTDPTMAKLKLLFSAKFKKDDTHDPALADFRQNAYHKLKVIAGPHKGDESDNSPLHDDGYSRADDMGNNTMDDIYFVGSDQPGPNKGSLDADDVIEFSFTAEQMIVDLSRKDAVIAKRGPYTAKITGKHPRQFHGVPKLFLK